MRSIWAAASFTNRKFWNDPLRGYRPVLRIYDVSGNTQLSRSSGNYVRRIGWLRLGTVSRRSALEGSGCRNCLRTRRGIGHSTAPVPPVASGPDQVWAIDFQFDSTFEGRQFKIASMADEHARESLLNIVDRSITAERLETELDAVIRQRGKPTVLCCENGPELISGTLRKFCALKATGISCIPPGEPWQNGYVESFNNRVREECLDLNQFRSLLEARVVIGDWKTDYNQYHRHSSLGYLTPNEYAQQQTNQT